MDGKRSPIKYEYETEWIWIWLSGMEWDGMRWELKICPMKGSTPKCRFRSSLSPCTQVPNYLVSLADQAPGRGKGDRSEVSAPIVWTGA